MNFFVDLDGTLMESRPRLHRLFNTLTGVEIPFDAYWSDKRQGRSNQWLLTELYQWAAGDVAAFTAEWMRTIENPGYLALDRPFPFSRHALKTLSEIGAVRILTARQDRAAACAQVEEAGFNPFVTEVLVTGGAISKERLCRELDVSPGPEDSFIGDTGDDIILARSFGAQAVAVLSGFRSAEYLVKRKPDVLHEHIGAYVDTLTYDPEHWPADSDKTRLD